VWHTVLSASSYSGGGATRLFARDRGSKEFHRDPTVGQHSKVWTRDKKNGRSSAKGGVQEMLDAGKGECSMINF